MTGPQIDNEFSIAILGIADKNDYPAAARDNKAVTDVV
jgi:hypothetical protein